MKTFKIYHSSKHLPELWDKLVAHDVFLQSTYLQALEIGAPSNFKLYYIGVFFEDTLIGVAVVQHVQLYLKDMFRKSDVSCVKEAFKNIISKILKGNVLVLGNLTQTGQHGMFFDQNKIVLENYMYIVLEALEDVKSEIKRTHCKTIRLIILKDFFTDDSQYNGSSVYKKLDLYQVSVQPNMILHVESNWNQMQDYLLALKKKYRDRFKRARKKLGVIETVELDLNTINQNQRVLYKLYLNVSNNAKFNSFILPENHFFSMKQNLENKFKVYGYFLEEELVGFYSLILNDDRLETYFLGYDSTYQYDNQLYLNMLYDMLHYGIENQYTSIVYARTAMTIKSSIGASAKPMQMYMKHTNTYWNWLLKPIFLLMNPKQEWEERHPFK